MTGRRMLHAKHVPDIKLILAAQKRIRKHVKNVLSGRATDAA